MPFYSHILCLCTVHYKDIVWIFVAYKLEDGDWILTWSDVLLLFLSLVSILLVRQLTYFLFFSVAEDTCRSTQYAVLDSLCSVLEKDLC